jgi:hypothetical protein
MSKLQAYDIASIKMESIRSYIVASMDIDIPDQSVTEMNCLCLDLKLMGLG